MKIFAVVIIAFIMAGPAPAAECPDGFIVDDGECVELCGAGYWRNTVGECEMCGNANGIYCPGDNTKHNCPAIDGREAPLWPATYPDMTLRSPATFAATTSISPGVEYCVITYELDGERGRFTYRQKYSAATDKYSLPSSNWWRWPHAGYYLTNLTSCPSVATYGDIAPCPAGAYCPGQADNWWCVNGAAPENYGMYICPDNTYSDDGASACMPCPAGTGNGGETIKAHAGIESCLPLCDDGATGLHAGDNIVFNLYQNDVCASPAIRIGFVGGTCCVRLEPGNAAGAVNIEYNGMTYRTVN